MNGRVALARTGLKSTVSKGAPNVLVLCSLGGIIRLA
jgi:hypothetical protein